jgi:NAD(P)-dependent dehydrogenase (short-subunit alcohol dehydrogenase family)
MKLHKKVSIITGASSGIGRHTALFFAKEGASVVVADVDTKGADETVSMIRAAGGEGITVETDVTAASDVRRMVKKTVERFGGLDILINVAGIFSDGDILKTDEATWHRILGVNLDGVFLCMKYCIPEMLEKGGTIVNIASEAGLVGIKDQVAYNVSKSGVVALTKSTALDLATRGIRVNCVCPGRVLTPMVRKVIAESTDPEETRRALSEDRPLMRMGTPEDIAAAVLFLASDESNYAIGSVLSVDGGYTAG